MKERYGEMAFILPLVGGLILYLIIHALVRAPGTALQTKFVSLGTLKGKTYDEIVAKCGVPNATSSKALEDGSVVGTKQWIATGYHIVLLFDENDICLGVSSETKV